MTDSPLRADVIIMGGGLVGLALAVALDAHGLTSLVIDPADPQATLASGFDGRASAVASASHRMLDAIGVGAFLAGQGQPIAAIRVSDGLRPGALTFQPDPDDGALGTMYENRALRRALREAAEAAEGVTLLQPARARHRARRRRRRDRHAGGWPGAPRAAAGWGRGPPFADPRGRRHPHRALAL